MNCGVVKHIDFARGWGFITPDSGEDLFFHRRDCLATFDSLAIGVRVTYDIEPSRRHPGKFAAIGVKPQ